MAHPQARYPSGETLIAEARQSAGLSDFGPDTFREGLEVLLRSLEQDAGLSQAAADGAVKILRRRLVNRLRIEEWFKTHPETARLGIDQPVSIIGLPRTGTTALGNMMSLDDQFRSLRIWEQAEPCPPPILAEEASDPRRLAAVREAEAMMRDHPQLAAMHLFDADASVEDTEVLGLEFKAQQFTYPVTSYHDWWRQTDMTSAYAYHRRVAQLLQSRRPPNRWLFKAPHHKFHLEALVKAYPDIRFIMTHRDPAKSVPSYASFVSAIFPPGSSAAADPVKFGQHVANHLRDGMERAMAARARLGEHRFLDIHHQDFTRDAEGSLKRAYDFLGLELRPRVRDAMLRWQAENHSGAHGGHRYTAEQFGLSKARLHADFDFYIRRFDIRVEG